MNKNAMLIICFVLFAGTAALASAVPINSTLLSEGTSSRANLDVTLKNVSAQAGNVTQVNIASTTITQSWQGYFGTITASLVLADSSNNQFYNWSIINPSGEVYSSPNSSVAWANIKCFNYTADGAEAINLSIVQGATWFNISSSSADAINNTYNITTHSGFDVGSVAISPNSCPSTYVYDNTGYQTSSFENILLTDNSSLVFTTILEDDVTGFDASSYDFQMLVAENGHGSAASSTTPYYFWVEIS